jgi:hypothetical protein
MQKGLHIASINTAKVHCCIVCVQTISNAAVVLCQPTRVQVAMLSKNWQQKADGSAVNWAEVQPPPWRVCPVYCNPRAQVPNGDADYDDGGD